MSSDTMVDPPRIVEVLAQLLQRVAVERQPLLIALAERLAASRYRGWAEAVADATRKAELLACAAREEQIASRIESLFPDAASIQREIVAANPDLEEINRNLFAGRPLAQQFSMQAQGERLGAATWRAAARRATEPSARDTFLICAQLEEQSAVVLESILSDAPSIDSA